MSINYSTSSGLKTASAQISTLRGSLSGIDVAPPTAGYNVVTVYDSADSNTSGKLVLSEVYVDAGTMGVNHEYFSPVAVNSGIYCTITGTGTDCRYFVRYSA